MLTHAIYNAMQSNLIVDISDVHAVEDDVAEMLLHHTAKNVERNVRPATYRKHYTNLHMFV